MGEKTKLGFRQNWKESPNFRAKAVFANTRGLTQGVRDKARETPWEKFPHPPLRTIFPIPFFYQTRGGTANRASTTVAGLKAPSRRGNRQAVRRITTRYFTGLLTRVQST